MFLTRYKEPQTFSAWGNEMNRFFDGLFPLLDRRLGRSADRYQLPELDVWADDDAYYVEAWVPGTALEDLDLTVEDQELRLAGRRNATEVDEDKYLHRERYQLEFDRRVKLPSEVSAEHIEAELEDGVLRIRLPKAEETKPRKITIRGK